MLDYFEVIFSYYIYILRLKYISVSVEEYSFDEWEGVYKDCIEGRDNVLVKPGYTDPRTFQ